MYGRKFGMKLKYYGRVNNGYYFCKQSGEQKTSLKSIHHPDLEISRSEHGKVRGVGNFNFSAFN